MSKSSAPSIILTGRSTASYRAWHTQLKELATESGVHFHLGFDSRHRPRMPVLSAATEDRVRNRLELNERERKEYDDHTKRVQLYQKDTALALKLLKSTVDEEVLELIRSNIDNYTKPSSTKLIQILAYLHDRLGGKHSSIQDERSNRDLEAIPDFTSEAIFSKAMRTLDELNLERENWGANYAWTDSALTLWFKKRIVLTSMDTFQLGLSSRLTFAQIKKKTRHLFRSISETESVKVSRLTETRKTTELVTIDNYAGVATGLKSLNAPSTFNNQAPGYGDEVVCFGCGGRGHTKISCPNPVLSPAEGGRKKSDRRCYGCGKTDHLLPDCPDSNPKIMSPVHPALATTLRPSTRDMSRKRPNPFVKVQGSDGNFKLWRKDRLPTVQLAFQQYEEQLQQANAAEFSEEFDDMEMFFAPNGMDIERIGGAEN